MTLKNNKTGDSSIILGSMPKHTYMSDGVCVGVPYIIIELFIYIYIYHTYQSLTDSKLTFVILNYLHNFLPPRIACETGGHASTGAI